MITVKTKPFYLSLLFVVCFFGANCNSRTKVEPCDLSYAISCASYYSDQDEFQQCLETLGGAACSLSDEDLAEVNASIASEIQSYTCSSSNPIVQSLVQANVSVTHVPETGEMIYYVDQYHSPLTEYENFVVTYTVSSAIELAKPGETIVLCPGNYPENLEIAGEDKNNITILNIAGGSAELAPYTKITGELGSSIEINGAKAVNIKGLTLTSGNSGLLSDTGYGGGLYVSSFLQMADANDRILIQNSIIEDNTSLYDGGGVYVEGYVDVYLSHVTLMRNVSTAGSGGAIAVSGNSTTHKLVVCLDCDLSQNSSLFSGNAVSVTGQDAFVIQNSTMQSNYPYSDYSLGAVALESESQFYAQDLDFGLNDEGTNNIDADVFLSGQLQSAFVDAGNEAWDLFEIGDLTEDELNAVLQEFTSEDGFVPGQYDYDGVASVACHYGTSSDQCVTL